ncbi:MAG: 50S ribosomal protein L24 [Eubacteriales bacterium]|nr:50S ribosomal protein L24 [Eubacteriales bacterium]
MAKIHVKKGDTVYVLSGKDRGKTGEVLRVIPKTNRVVVEGVNVVSRHKKAIRPTDQSGIVQMEAPIHASNVMYVDPKSKRPSKTGVKVLENGDRVRYSKASGNEISTLKTKKK